MAEATVATAPKAFPVVLLSFKALTTLETTTATPSPGFLSALEAAIMDRLREKICLPLFKHANRGA